MADYTPISMIRGNSTIVDSTPIVDGQILFDETRKCLFMDNGSTREKYSGLGADSNIANVEDTTTASQPYTTGEFVVVEGQLYKVTASIATGDTFSVGTNIATDTVGAELTQINADLTANKPQADGAIFKMGVTPEQSSDTVTFETPFSDDNYLVFLTPRNSNNALIWSSALISKTASGFKFRTAYSSNGTNWVNYYVSIQWVAIHF